MSAAPEHRNYIENIDGGYRWSCSCGGSGTIMIPPEGMPLDVFLVWCKVLGRQHPEPRKRRANRALGVA